MQQFAEWLSTTGPSVFIQNNYNWFIPLIQSIHIVAIATVFGSMFMINMRVLGWSGMDQTLRQTTNRFGPWLTGSLWVLLITGTLMVIGEPVRELVTFSFWFKMVLVVIGTVIAVAFRVSLRKRETEWEQNLAKQPSTKLFAILTLLLWCAIIFLGRLIAYDHIWGSWSPASAG
jgi:Ca2+/Na+ antiporter